MRSPGQVHPVRVVFWLSFALIAYAYFGYLVLLVFLARLRPKPIQRGSYSPSVSILIAARNEAERLPGKLANLAALRYPAEQIQIVISSDGSTDRTAEILREQGARVVPVIFERSAGKASALNGAVKCAGGDILVFMDARQTIDPDAISELVSPFSDPQVGAVSGELLLQNASGAASADALGIYWKIEKAVRKLESQCGSVVGVTGAIYAIRRELYTEIPPGTILDDVFVPMSIARSGKRVVFQPSAIARDVIFSDPGKEFSRKIRTLTGNYQLVQLAPWMLSPANPLLFRFISHKLLRLIVPALLIAMLVSAALSGGIVYETIFVLQLSLYAAALLGTVFPITRRAKPIAIANTFVMLNVAAALAFYNFVAGRDKVWT